MVFSHNLCACPACPVEPGTIRVFNRGRSGRSYWGGYFFRMPLRGVGPTLSPLRAADSTSRKPACKPYGLEAGSEA